MDLSTIADHYRIVVMQPGTLCNLDCDYCYLPLRKTTNLMPPQVAARVADDVRQQLDRPGTPDPVTILWHCSEPLTTPKAHFCQLLEPFEQLRKAGRIRHRIQTNATLVDNEWLGIFLAYGFHVSVSVDGPPHMDIHRKHWNGRPAHEAIMQGVQHLRAVGLNPNAIAVVTPETITRGTELIDWFTREGFPRVALNLEQREGANTDRPLISPHQAEEFWYDVMAYLHRTGAAIQVREVGIVANYLRGTPPPFRDPIPTVTRTGDVVLSAVELAGVTDPTYGDFIAGNVLTEPIQGMLARQHSIPYVEEFERGLALCKQTCPLWGACEGAYAPNRYAEHGRFNVAATNHCRASRMGPFRAALNLADPTRDVALVGKLQPLITALEEA